MLTLRPSAERGHANHGWLDTLHTFSFDDYFDPAQTGFRALRVINEDRVAPEAGFPMHPHREMEIITYVISGSLAHRDSLGSGSVISSEDVQVMSAGTGIVHSEFNPSPTEEVHLLQIWIRPAKAGVTPRYEQKSFPATQKANQLCLLASSSGEAGSIMLYQDVKLYAAVLEPGPRITYRLADNRAAWIQLISGEVSLGDSVLRAGDGAAVENAPAVSIQAPTTAEFLLFDLR